MFLILLLQKILFFNLGHEDLIKFTTTGRFETTITSSLL